MPPRLARSRGLPPLHPRLSSESPIPKWEASAPRERSTAEKKADNRLALHQATEDATHTETFVKEKHHKKRAEEAWEHFRKLRRHEARLETLLQPAFKLKQHNVQDQRTRERIGDVLSVLEQVERAQDALRNAFPRENFPPELRILEGEEEREQTDKLLKIRAAIQPDDYWQLTGDEKEDRQVSGTRQRKEKKSKRGRRIPAARAQ